jgi:hypothetical protein
MQKNPPLPGTEPQTFEIVLLKWLDESDSQGYRDQWTVSHDMDRPL